MRYFGPYGHAWAIRETVDLMLRVFPVRTCSAGVFKRSAQIGRPCLLGYIGKCSAPCVGRVTPEEHRELAEDFCDFMVSRTGTYLSRLEQEMHEAAEEMEYEKAARLRDDIGALRRAMEKNAVVLADATDADLIAVAEDELEAAVQIFHVRGGRVRGQRGWVTDKVEAVDTAGLVEHALQQLYGEEKGEAVPKEVLVPALPEDTPTLSQWLAERRGSQVSLRIPQRGDKKALMETVHRNAQQSLALHKTKRASDLTTRSRAWRRSPRPRSWTARRCASSASTSRTSRATTWSPPWSSSRTGWRGRASTGASRSNPSRGRTTSAPCTRSSPGASAATSRRS